MIGVWTITRLPDHRVRLTYRDYYTARSWACGTAPASVGEAGTMEWLASRVRPGDVICIEGNRTLSVLAPASA